MSCIIRSYASFNLNGYVGFRGKELDFYSIKEFQIIAQQVDLNKRHVLNNPSLKLTLVSSGQTDKVKYNLFFDNHGGFIGGAYQECDSNSKGYSKHEKVEGLDYLVMQGKSISSILSEQTIPLPLLHNNIVASLKDNTVREEYYIERVDN